MECILKKVKFVFMSLYHDAGKIQV